uniref:Calpain catalytic domain-containing protein n=1 Tax=Arion vulgaris TaxID=1028688 RepID=A0A0B7BIK0_9EUPU
MGGVDSIEKNRQWDSKPLFEDRDFPADSSVLYRGGQRFGVQWKRPWMISKNPVFIEDGTAYNDVDQGDLGNCWFLSSVACLAVSKQKELLSHVIPKDQGFGPEYNGKFKFNFWQYGKFVEVVVDDRLPTYNGKLIYGRNAEQPHEYWVPLLEKACAKLYGNYNVLDGGRIHTALVDLTGGLGEMVPLKEQISDSDITDLLLRSQKLNSFMGGSVFVKQFGNRELVQESGLVEGHAYTILKVKEVNTSKGKIVLLHIRNPHGKGEWKGAWSDMSAEWKTLSAEEKKEMFKIEDDGEFWISVSDFRKNFDELELCHLRPEGLSEGNTGSLDKVQWKIIEHRGKWDRLSSAGGPPISFMSKKFWSNPQIELKVPPSTQATTVVISLFEVDDYLKKSEVDISIGFSVFQFANGKKPERLTADNYYEFSPRMVQSSGVSWPYRERTRRFALESGDYMIVPYTSRVGQEASFYIRIFAESSGISPITITETRGSSVSPDPETSTSSEIAALNKAFDANSGKVNAIDAAELIDVLSAGLEAEGKAIRYSVETCRCLISMSLSQTSKGLIDKNGLHRVWAELTTWREAFRLIDKDNSKTIDAKELKNLFDIIELTTSPATTDALIKRYGGKNEKVSEDDFLQGVCKAVQLRGKYLELHRKGKIDIELNEWMTFGLSI